jgi:hypothetical protein
MYLEKEIEKLFDVLKEAFKGKINPYELSKLVDEERKER